MNILNPSFIFTLRGAYGPLTKLNNLSIWLQLEVTLLWFSGSEILIFKL